MLCFLFPGKQPNHLLNALSLLLRHGAQVGEQPGLPRGQALLRQVICPVPLVGISYEVVDGGVEVVRYSLQDFDFRLRVVVFVFVDGGLGDKYGLRKTLLADAIFLPQGFQIFQHGQHLPVFITFILTAKGCFMKFIIGLDNKQWLYYYIVVKSHLLSHNN